MIEALLFSWHKNVEYAQKLVADVADDRMVYQPAANMNHPAWVFSHLNAYHPVIVSMVNDQPFDDPKDHPFGMKSKPLADTAAYPSRGQLIESFCNGHEDVDRALRSVGTRALQGPVQLKRWAGTMPTVGVALVYLMIVHESTHLGQLSAWRRVQAMPSV